MELLKDILIDFCLFSLIEGFNNCCFFETFEEIRKYKFKEVILFSLGISIFSTMSNPLYKQIIIILFMGIFIKFTNKNVKFKKCIFISFISVLILFLIEVYYSMFLNYIINFDSFLIKSSIKNKIIVFIFMIPIRFIEFYIYKNINNIWRNFTNENCNGRSKT